MRRLRLVTFLTVSALAASLLAAPVTAGAAKQPAIDKSAILRLGFDLTASGGASPDPASVGGAAATDAAGFYLPYLYDTMIRIDEKGDLQPGLATKWSTPDPNTVLFTLRQGVKFQDGTPLTTAAVKQGWDRTRNSTALKDELWTRITAIDLVGNDQIKVTLNQPSAGAFLTKIMASGTGGVPSPAALAKYGDDFKNHPVGAGPYAFDSFTPGQKLSLRKWDGYWDAKNSQKLGGFDVVQTAPGAPAVASILRDQIDLAKFAIADTPGLEGQPNIVLDTFNKTTASLYLIPCTTRGPMANAAARAAVSTAIDRQAINQATYDGAGTPAETLFPKGHPYYEADLENQHPYSVKKAQALAKKAGIAPGTPLKIMALASTLGSDRAAVVLQDELSKIGFNPSVTISSSFLNDAKTQQPDLVMLSTDATAVQSFLLNNATANAALCQYNNPAIDTAVGSILTSTEGSGAAKVPWREVQETLANDLVFMTLVHAPIVWGRTKQVQDFAIAPINLNRPIPWPVYMTKS